ncbi:MAG: hypothetical protein EBU46_10975 [Nitrosomonadaceae bacterium]|nr:hypothetical protein [Nitrosomonadaceae bacterium]
MGRFRCLGGPTGGYALNGNVAVTFDRQYTGKIRRDSLERQHHNFMPCRYDESPEEIAAAKKKEFERLSSSLKKELDKTTRLLCWVMNLREHADHEVDFVHELDANAELAYWYNEHKKKDEARLQSALREKALKKLTRAERAAIEAFYDLKKD